MDPITSKAAGGGAEILKKMMEQGAGGAGQPGMKPDELSKFEQVRTNKLEELQKAGKVEDVSKAADLQPSQRMASFLEKVNSGQHDLDKIIKDLQSGRKFDMKELMSMQLQVQQLSQQMDMTTKLIGKAIENINKAINTQV
jgi:hypothetical protein